MAGNGVLVVAETTVGANGSATVSPVTFELLGIGKKLAASSGGKLSVVLVGSGVKAQAGELAARGADPVYVADAPELGNYVAETYVPVVVAAVEQADPAIVLLAHTLTGRELGPRVAFRLGSGLVTDVTNLAIENGALVMTKPVYGGNALAEYVANDTDAIQIATVRPRVFEPAEGSGAAQAKVVDVAIPAEVGSAKAKVVETVRAATEGPRLKDAKVIVSGGRGVGGPDNWHYVDELAQALGGAVGASRAVTDAGWVPSTLQVGLTGTTVTPDLYIAVGISGAVQHLAGMTGSRNIVAINRDADANIFKHARYGAVGDYKQILPAFTDRIKELRK